MSKIIDFPEIDPDVTSLEFSKPVDLYAIIYTDGKGYVYVDTNIDEDDEFTVEEYIAECLELLKDPSN